MAKGKKTGGRPKGGKNKATVEREAIAADRLEKLKAEGVTPLEYMLSLMRDEEALPTERFEAAKAAAPYIHPKLASVEHKGNEEAPFVVLYRDDERV